MTIMRRIAVTAALLLATAALSAFGATGLASTGIDVLPPEGGGIAKACNFDTYHWATVDFHVNSTNFYGYSVFYSQSSGWGFGTHSHETVYKTEFHHWDSPVNGLPGIWNDRDSAMPDAPKTIAWFTIYVTGDNPNGPDPTCSVRFDKGIDY